jgi:hypothetical protein
MRAYAALGRKEYPRAIELSQRALGSVPVADPSTRGLVALNLGIALRLTGATTAAVEALTLAAASGQAAGDALLASASPGSR